MQPSRHPLADEVWNSEKSYFYSRWIWRHVVYGSGKWVFEFYLHTHTLDTSCIEEKYVLNYLLKRQQKPSLKIGWLFELKWWTIWGVNDHLKVNMSMELLSQLILSKFARWASFYSACHLSEARAQKSDLTTFDKINCYQGNVKIVKITQE